MSMMAARQAMVAIQQSSSAANDMIDSIRSVIEQINAFQTTVSAATTAEVTEAENAATGLADMSNRLQTLVGRFRF
jgi:methyl-accepting chemotaxis protein